MLTEKTIKAKYFDLCLKIDQLEKQLDISYSDKIEGFVQDLRRERDVLSWVLRSEDPNDDIFP